MPRIAIIGASQDRSKYGNKAVRAYRLMGYDVYPVHPTAPGIEGLPTYRTVAEIPADFLDRVSVYLSPEKGMLLLDQIATKKIGELWFNPGSSSPELAAQARSRGLNVVEGCSIVDIGVDPHRLD
jgi:hypothetical protein